MLLLEFLSTLDDRFDIYINFWLALVGRHSSWLDTRLHLGLRRRVGSGILGVVVLLLSFLGSHIQRW